MSDTQNKKVSPIVAIAAGSVILFSAVGIGVMTGVIPSSSSKPADTPAPMTAQEPAPGAAPMPAPAPVAAPAPAAQPKAPVVKKQEPARVASTEPARSVAEAPKPAKPGICANCGSVMSVDVVKHEGEGSGLGAVAGGVAGGVLGNQVGRGTGRKVATVVGIAGGAYAGHQVEKHVKSTNTYEVLVRMDNGSNRSFSFEKEPGYRAGDKVKVIEGRLVAN